MTGSLLQLVSIGDQDKHFIGNPQISYFKSYYKQHTNFALESIPINFQEECDFGKKNFCKIAKRGDLLHKLLLEIELPYTGDNDISWINNIGNFIIEYVELRIGDHTIDKHYGEYMDIYSEVNIPEGIKRGYKEMVAKNNFYTNFSQPGPLKLYVPLLFWFCNTIGNSLPLIALQFHDVSICVKFRNLNDCLFNGINNNFKNKLHFKKCVLFADYIFLDNIERKKFAQSQHEYLIEQIQYNTHNISKSSTMNIDLHFNLPVKEMIWFIRNCSVDQNNDWSNYSNTSHNLKSLTENKEMLEEAVIYINGQERFYPRSSKYFRLVQPLNHHTNIPENFIYFYSFSIFPEKNQPSGSINFSRIDNSKLSLKLVDNISDSNIYIYAINYNILIIKSGMGGLKFSS